MVFRRKASECSPRPYRFGLLGRDVLRLRYWDSNTRGEPEVLNSVSPPALATAKLNGDSVKVNCNEELEAEAPEEGPGLGKTSAGTW